MSKAASESKDLERLYSDDLIIEDGYNKHQIPPLPSTVFGRNSEGKGILVNISLNLNSILAINEPTQVNYSTCLISENYSCVYLILIVHIIKSYIVYYHLNRAYTNELFQEISLESTIRLSWYDERIKANTNSASKDKNLGYIIINRAPVEHFWFPDIYIDKAKAIRKPTYEIPPAYLRIYPSGRFLYSARVNYDISCPMDFKFYPVSW